jgi:glucose/arabinose dehydrogenase
MLNMAKSLAAAVFTLALSAPLAAATLPNGFSETLVTGGLSAPTAMAFTPDGRLFVCQQGGQLRVIENGTLLPTPFVSLTVNSSGERGLLGVAIDPNFTFNQFVYVYYTATTPAIHNRISRFTANGNVAAGGSEVVLLDLDNLSGATNHNGGGIHFALDGTLIAGVGENATTSNAQTLNNLLGKMLRINADGTIPADNPFFNQASGKNRAIWALGLRNPYTFAVQPGTGPFLGCAITGGTFYNPAASQFPPAFVGDYFFADLCGGWINRRDPDTGSVTTFASGISQPVDLQVGPDGSLYYLARGSGSVFRVSFPGFTDTLTAGVTMIRAVHVTELRDRIGALRTRFQLSPFNWTDPSLGTGTMALAIHIVDLRTALADAYLAAGQDAPEYTDPTLQPQSTVIKAAHIIELRSAILTLEAS